jgi:hypothetical protein
VDLWSWPEGGFRCLAHTPYASYTRNRPVLCELIWRLIQDPLYSELKAGYTALVLHLGDNSFRTAGAFVHLLFGSTIDLDCFARLRLTRLACGPILNTSKQRNKEQRHAYPRLRNRRLHRGNDPDRLRCLPACGCVMRLVLAFILMLIAGCLSAALGQMITIGPEEWVKRVHIELGEF